MTAKIALLPDRGVVSVTGDDAAKFLDNIITNDMGLFDKQAAIFAGLLSPQGKILFDFFVAKADGGYFLDVAMSKAAELAKRLIMYKLRARLEIIDISALTRVAVVWGSDRLASEAGMWLANFSDPRCAALSNRLMGTREQLDALNSDDLDIVSEAAFDERRIKNGVPEGGKDYAFGDAFPHEALFDQFHGVSFTKGCYVGQEIVARMEHRGTARKRIVRVTADAPLPPAGTEIKAGDVVIGVMGSSDRTLGLAMLRLDRAAEFEAKGVPLTAGGVTISPDSFDMARLMPKSPDPTGL